MRKQRFGALAPLAVAGALILAGGAGAMVAPMQAQAEPVVSKGFSGIHKTGKRYYVYKKGKRLTGNGRVGRVWYAVTSTGRLRGYQKGKWCHYADGGYMSRRDALDFKAYKRACSIVGKISRPSDGKSAKRLKAFRWVMRKAYVMHRRWDFSRVSWPAVYAFDHFNGKGGDCHSDGAAFAYLAAAIGYTDIDVCIDAGPRAHQSHCWAMIDHNRIFDPLFAEREFSRYYNSRGGSYEVNPLYRIKICQFEKRHGRPVRPKKIRNDWVKLGSGWYYRLSSGKKAVGSVRNRAANPNFRRGTYYVFDRRGRLLAGKGTRVVKVRGKRYRVDGAGRAKSGWDARKARWSDRTGLVATGIRVVGGKLALFGADGVLDRSTSASLELLSERGSAYSGLAARLRELGMRQRRALSQRSCETYAGETGENVIHLYKGFKVLTFRSDSGAEYVMSLE